jgi:hypothetical protein
MDAELLHKVAEFCAHQAKINESTQSVVNDLCDKVEDLQLEALVLRGLVSTLIQTHPDPGAVFDSFDRVLAVVKESVPDGLRERYIAKVGDYRA